MPQEYLQESLQIGQLPSSGQILFTDDFTNGLSWDTAGDLADRITAISPITCLQGGASARLNTGSQGIGADLGVNISKNLPTPINKIITIEWTFLITTIANASSFATSLTWRTRTQQRVTRLQYNVATTRWQVTDTDDSFQNIGTGAYIIRDNSWHKIRMQINLTNRTYTFVNINDTEITSGFPTTFQQSNVADTGDLFQLTLELITAGTNAAEMFIDNVNIQTI